MKLLILTFSKNRPCQLYSQLCSTRDHIHGDFKEKVIYYSDERFEKSYKELILLFPEVEFIKQSIFYIDVIKIIRESECEYAMMSTDDSFYIRDFFIEDGCKYNSDYLLSLRLAPHLKVMQTANKDHPCKTNMPVPEFTRVDNKNCWQWGKGICEWYYPLTCDATIFPVNDLLYMLESINFTTPNSLEGNLMLKFYGSNYYHKFGLCYDKSIYLNTPWNIVSTEGGNPNSNININIFQDQWEIGNRINHEKYYDMLPESCHMELPLEFIKR